MTQFRTYRPLRVQAEQCIQHRTVLTASGPRWVRQGDWVVHGEGGECYVVDDAFFQRTFTPDAVAAAVPVEERHYGA